MTRIPVWSAPAPDRPLQLAEREWESLAPDDVEIAVEHCGLCHSDLSILQNEWGSTPYPVVAGHEVVGRVLQVGDRVQGVGEGQRVGVGWNAGSCMHCRACLAGDQHLCPAAQPTIVGHDGGFAQRVRSHWAWAIPLPEELDAATAGPLLCGGVTVFSPLLELGIRPTHRAAVVGIGGLGHLALQFLRAWGCEVTALTSSESKFDEARQLGAHHVTSSRDSDAIRKLAGAFDLLLVTVNVPLDWDALLAMLGPRGKMHLVGAVLEPIPVRAFDLIAAQRSVSGSPTGSPTALRTMLEFAARHGVAPQVERFPMSQVNAALDHLRAGKARYRVVLDADWREPK